MLFPNHVSQRFAIIVTATVLAIKGIGRYYRTRTRVFCIIIAVLTFGVKRDYRKTWPVIRIHNQWITANFRFLINSEWRQHTQMMRAALHQNCSWTITCSRDWKLLAETYSRDWKLLAETYSRDWQLYLLRHTAETESYTWLNEHVAR